MVNSWHIGSIKITPIIETDASNVIQNILPMATKESISDIDWLFPYFADASFKLKAVVQAFIIEADDCIILVDTCVGNDKQRLETDEWNMLSTDFLIHLEDLGYGANKITHVLCTHLHFDHVGWNTRLVDGKWIPTFPNAKYIFAQQEFDYWKEFPKNEIEDDHSAIRDSVLPIIEAGMEILVPTNYEITTGVRLLSTPGHTPFHCSVLIESEFKTGLITGDAMHHPCQIAQPSWSTLADTFPEKAIQSREALLAKYCGSSTLIIGSHFAWPSAGYIIQDRYGRYKFRTAV